MPYTTIDPEIFFEVKTGLTKKGLPDLFSEDALVSAMEMTEDHRKPQRARMSNQQIIMRSKLDFWLRTSTKNYVSYLMELIINNRDN